MTDHTEKLFTGYTGRMSLVLSFGWLVALLGRGVISPLLPAVIDSLSISSVQAGLVLSLMMALHSLIQYPGGAFSDQLSRTTVLVTSFGVLTVGFSLLVFAGSYWQFLVGGLLVGLGTGLYFTPQRSMLSDMFIEQRGRAFGVNFAAGSLGSALSGGLAIVALGIGVWQWSFVPLVALALIVLALLHLTSREGYVLKRARPDLLGTVRRIQSSRDLSGTILAYGLFAFAWQGIVGFLPTFLQASKALSPTLASVGFAIMFVVAMVVMPVAGNVSDSIPRPTVANVALGVSVVGILGMLVASSVPVVFAAIVVMAVGIRAYPPVMQAHVMDLVPDESTGSDFGAVKTVYTLIGSAGPVYVGFVSGVTSYAVAFAGLATCLVGSIAVGLWLYR